jgi:3-hydroxyisobutyryl-CoA hydrolase
MNSNGNDCVKVNSSELIIKIKLNQPKKLNTLDTQMLLVLEKTIEPIQNSDKIKIIILEGERTFCAGGDIKKLYDQMKEKDYKAILEFYDLELKMDYLLSIMKPLQVSIWNGYAMGGGVGISINSKFRIATEKTVFAMPEAHIGLFPDVGAAYFLPRIFNNPSVGLFVGLTGYRITGRECVRSGLATHFIDSSKIDLLKAAIDEKTNERTNFEELDKIISNVVDEKFNNFEFINEKFINDIFTFDSLDGIFGRLEEFSKNENEDVSNFAKFCLDKMRSSSPLSLLIFYEFVKISLNFTNLKQTLDIDRILFERCYLLT